MFVTIKPETILPKGFASNLTNKFNNKMGNQAVFSAKSESLTHI